MGNLPFLRKAVMTHLDSHQSRQTFLDLFRGFSASVAVDDALDLDSEAKEQKDTNSPSIKLLNAALMAPSAQPVRERTARESAPLSSAADGSSPLSVGS